MPQAIEGGPLAGLHEMMQSEEDRQRAERDQTRYNLNQGIRYGRDGQWFLNPESGAHQGEIGIRSRERIPDAIKQARQTLMRDLLLGAG